MNVSRGLLRVRLILTMLFIGVVAVTDAGRAFRQGPGLENDHFG